MAKHMVKFHPNFHSNNICQEYLEIYGQTLAITHVGLEVGLDLSLLKTKHL